MKSRIIEENNTSNINQKDKKVTSLTSEYNNAMLINKEQEKKIKELEKKINQYK